MNYNVIYDFCKVRNKGTAMVNGVHEYPPRVIFIIDLLESMGLNYTVDTFLYKGNNLHNIYLKGTSNKWVMAHHDVCNHTTDNANDNSASVINAIGLKTLRPDINIALVDGEEPPLMGAGSSHFAEQFKNGTISVDWVLNLELSGSGGTNFFIGNYKTELTNKIKDKFGCAVMNVPFNDASILINKANINAALINPCPLRKEGSVLIVKQVGIVNAILNPDGDVSDNIKIGDYIDVDEYDDMMKYLFDSGYNPINDSDMFIVEDSALSNIPVGTMPKLHQMDTSILNRCHTNDDTVEHINVDDMRNFVEKVLTIICDL